MWSGTARLAGSNLHRLEAMEESCFSCFDLRTGRRIFATSCDAESITCVGADRSVSKQNSRSSRKQFPIRPLMQHGPAGRLAFLSENAASTSPPPAPFSLYMASEVVPAALRATFEGAMRHLLHRPRNYADHP
jgi:hypothetical protein